MVQLIVQLMNLVDILQTFLKGDLRNPVSSPSLHKGNKAENLIESVLSAKCSKVTNPVQGETCAADLLLIISSEEKANLFSQADKIDLTNCDTEQDKTQGSTPRKRTKNFDAECVIIGAEQNCQILQ